MLGGGFAEMPIEKSRQGDVDEDFGNKRGSRSDGRKDDQNSLNDLVFEGEASKSKSPKSLEFQRLLNRQL